MTLDDLIEQLEDMRSDLGGDTEVRIAHQPSWPLRGKIAAVTTGDNVPLEPEDEADGADDDADRKMVWIAASSGAPSDESPYAPRWAWNGME